MIATLLAWTGVLVAAGVTAPAPPPPSVRLAPVRCSDPPDATVRTPFRVELRERLLADDAPDDPDVLLVSIACNGSDATVLAVRQNGGTAVRRLVPLAAVAPEARPRELALAAVEVVRVADARQAAPAPTVVAAPAPAPRPASRVTFTFGAAAFLLGGYLSQGEFLATGGASIRAGIELGPERPPAPSWQPGLAYELTGAGGSYETVVMNGLLALIQRRGRRVVPELGVGARIGWISDYPTPTTGTLRIGGGPVASVALGIRVLPGISSDFVAETGYDFHGHGAWLLSHVGLTLRF